MRWLVLLIAVSALSIPPAGTAGVVETRGGVTYESEEWPSSDPKHMVDVKPQPVGGTSAFLARMDYPVVLRREAVTGTMKVRVRLDAAGNVRSAEVTHSVHQKLDAIVLRAIHETRWKPAMKAGKAVPYTFEFPVTFSRGGSSNQVGPIMR